MKFFIVVTSLVAILQIRTITPKVIIPREFEDIEDLQDSIDHVNYILSRNSADSAEKRAASPVADSGVDCNAPDNANVTIRTSNKTVEFTWLNRPTCSLVEVPVKINTRQLSNPIPSYTRLYRCMGSSEWAPTLKHCTVKTKEQITVKYLDLNIYQEFGAKMYNHTECAEECIVKEHHCDPVTERYENCHCRCMIDSSYCDSSYQSFDSSTCKCICSTVQQCSLYREWNPSTCNCECAKSIEDMCKTGGYVIDESTCSCDLSPATTNPPPATTNNPPQAATTTSSTTNNPPQAATTSSSTTNNPPQVATTSSSTTNNPPQAATTTSSTTNNPPQAATTTSSTTNNPPQAATTSSSMHAIR